MKPEQAHQLAVLTKAQEGRQKKRLAALLNQREELSRERKALVENRHRVLAHHVGAEMIQADPWLAWCNSREAELDLQVARLDEELKLARAEAAQATARADMMCEIEQEARLLRLKELEKRAEAAGQVV